MEEVKGRKVQGHCSLNHRRHIFLSMSVLFSLRKTTCWLGDDVTAPTVDRFKFLGKYLCLEWE